MRAIFLLFVLVTGFSCVDKNTISEPDKDEAYLLHEFKLRFFKQCIKVGFNESYEIKKVMDYDVSSAGDFPLGIFGYKLADSLALAVRDDIIADSIRIGIRWDHNIGKKRVFLLCLDAYESEELHMRALDFVESHLEALK